MVFLEVAEAVDKTNVFPTKHTGSNFSIHTS